MAKIEFLDQHPEYKRRPPSDSQGGGPTGGDVSERVAKLEVILPTLATKADIEGVRSDISRWMLGTVLTVIGTSLAALIGMATIWHQPGPPAPPTAAAPVVVQVPAYVQQVSPSPAPSATTGPTGKH